MDAMRQRWTDDRLDDLNGKVDAFRLETRTEFAAVRSEMKEGFDKVDSRFDKVDSRFEVLEARLIQIYRTMLWFCGIAMAALLGFIATQI